MKQLLVVLLSVLTSHASFAQPVTRNTSASAYSKPSRDYLMLQFGYDTWLNAPDSIKITGIGRAFNAYICYDFPIKQSNFSFAAGAGIGTSNIYFKDQEMVLTDTTAAVQFKPETLPYKRYKLNTAYVEAPFEIRYFSNKENRNKGLKIAAGLKVGTLLSAHTKGKYTLNNKPIIEKVSTKRYLESWRYAATLRVGYGNFSVFGSYNLGGMYKVNSAPEEIRAVSIGICLSGL